MARKIAVEACPNGCGTLLRPEYKQRFGQCIDCYLGVEAKIADVEHQFRLNQRLHGE
jgi:hypothetical protein